MFFFFSQAVFSKKISRYIEARNKVEPKIEAAKVTLTSKTSNVSDGGYSNVYV